MEASEVSARAGRAAIACTATIGESDYLCLLVILTEQQRLRAMSAYGNTWLSTRHLDSIAGSDFKMPA